MPFVATFVKRPPAFMAGGHEKIARREIPGFWRELARPVTFFDLCSPANFRESKIAEFFRKKRARQELNLRPPALEGRCSIQLSYG